MTIVKVQRPIASNAPIRYGECLVYDEARSHIAEQLVPQEVWDRMRNSLKEFYHADWDEQAGIWRIGKHVEFEDW